MRHDGEGTGIVAIWTVAATYIGTVVGAGFASGQEVMQFFTAHGNLGAWAVWLVGPLFAGLGLVIMFLARRISAVSYQEILDDSCGTKAGRWIGIGLGLFLFGTLSVMLAGGGAICMEFFGWSNQMGIAATAGLSLLFAISGWGGVKQVNRMLVPLLVCATLAISVAATMAHPVTTEFPIIVPSQKGFWNEPFISLCAYVSYNLLLSIGVLVSLGSRTERRQTLVWGGLTGGLLLGLLIVALDHSLRVHLPETRNWEIPVLYVCRHDNILQVFYPFVLWGEIISSVVGTLFSLVERVRQDSRQPAWFLTCLLLGLALLVAPIGFARLLGWLYPICGILGLGVLAAILRRAWQYRLVPGSGIGGKTNESSRHSR